MKNEKKYVLGVIALIVVIGLTMMFITLFNGKNRDVKVTNFEECAEAGNPIMESFPRQCRADGVTYTEVIPEQDGELLLPELFREKAIQHLGAIPIEGFDPALYKGAFPGLVDSDFNDTAAIGGTWIFEESTLTFVRDSSQGITSADGTLTDEGILTLLHHLELRFNLQINSEEDLTLLIGLISEGNTDSGSFNIVAPGTEIENDTVLQ